MGLCDAQSPAARHCGAYAGASTLSTIDLPQGIETLLSDRDVERITGRARSTLQKDRVLGTGIPFVRVGRLVRYRQSDVSTFLAALPSLRSTSEAA